MRLAKLTMYRFLLLFFVSTGLQLTTAAQENSPYSRYGLGDLVPNHNIYSRGMGGIAAGIVDYQSINFTNPAAIAQIANTIFDVGGEVDIRTLKTKTPVKKFRSVNTQITYLQLGVPLTTEKMRKKEMSWGLSFGLRPISRVNYKIEKYSRLSTIDSLASLFEGSGGVSQFFIGTAVKIKDFSFGINGGYMFGSKEYSTRLIFVNDTVEYYRSNSANNTNFGGWFLNAGIQYEKVFNKEKTKEAPRVLRIGVYGNLQHKLKAKQDIIRETFAYNSVSSTYRIDSVYDKKDIPGDIQYPSGFGAGFSYTNEHWLFGADVEVTNWNKYRFYGQKDQVQSNWVARVGAQYYPAKLNTPVKKYFNFVRYRAGFFYGPDYIKVNNSRPEYGFTFGTGMPLTSLRQLSYSGEYVVLNTGIEIGARGDKNTNLKESTVRFSIGVSMNARWFRKYKYD
jgi:hypothetical protein